MLRRFLLLALVLLPLCTVAAPPAAHANDKIAPPPPMPNDAGPKRVNTTAHWKGEPPKAFFNAGGMTGVGVLDSVAGVSVLGVGAVKLAHKGFIEDFTNQVYLEAQAGGLFLGGTTYFQWALQLRWDFVYDDYWTFYAIGGLGGMSGGGRGIFYPRFGIGAQWNLFVVCGIRAEITRDFMGAGLIFPL